jgi:hypothetical protein
MPNEINSSALGIRESAHRLSYVEAEERKRYEPKTGPMHVTGSRTPLIHRVSCRMPLAGD